MRHHWIEDDPFDGLHVPLDERADALSPSGVASVVGLGSALSVLLLVLATIALVD